MDWNWFFSAIAQSSAAIVGLFGAFIITKIINNQAKYRENLNLIKDYLNQSEYFIDQIRHKNFSFYNSRVRDLKLKKISDDIKETHENKYELKSPKQYYLKYDFSIYDDREKILKNIKKKIDNPKQKISEHDFSSFSNITYTTVHRWVDDEGQKIHKLVADINKHIRDLKSFLSRIRDNPESSSLITISIIFSILLFGAGVVLPLSFLPTSKLNNVNLLFGVCDIFSLKGLLLSIVTLLFTSIMIIFLVINVKLKYSEEKIEKLEYYTDITNYSKYLENMQENKEFIRKNTK